MKVAILGCGPSGLLAAHACLLEGVDFQIFSKRRKSELFGSQYLHEPIPEISRYDDHVNVRYVTIGTPEEYRRKTHGKFWDGIVAPEDFTPDHLAWNIRHAYDVLWQKYGHLVNDYQIQPHAHGAVAFDHVQYDLDLFQFDLVVSTVPRTIWKVPGEEFVFSEGWAMGDAPERGIFCQIGDQEDNTIVCDGSPHVPYTRISRVFGYASIEWPIGHAPTSQVHAARIVRPLAYRPNPSTPNPTADWLHVGRYGQWQKGVVVTDAFNDVIKKIRSMR